MDHSEAPLPDNDAPRGLRQRYLHLRGGLAVALVFVTVVAGLLYSRENLALDQPVGQGPVPAPNGLTAVGPCQQADVDLITSDLGDGQLTTVHLAVGLAYPGHLSCNSPDVTVELTDATGVPLTGVTGSPTHALGGGSCTTTSDKCGEGAIFAWSNWCGSSRGKFQAVAIAYGGRLRSSTPIPAPPACTDRAAASSLDSLGH
ncbi:MAG: hypothetical protein QOJ33_1244 [Chloroflexota bacterium]|nr:hypothetical protein [Chloroflexota bacterium]